MNSRKICMLVAITIAFTSCVETIVMDPYDKDLPVMVNCILNPDEHVHTLYLQHVYGKSDRDIIPIEDASVYLTTPSLRSLTDTIFFHHVEGNRWETSEDSFYKGKQVRDGAECHIFVELLGRDPIIAVTTVPKKRYNLDIELYPIDPYAQYKSFEEYKNHTVVWFGLEHGNDQITTPPVWIIATKNKIINSETLKDHYSYIATDHPLADNFNINGKQLKDLPIGETPDNALMEERWTSFNNTRRLMPDLPLHDDFVRIEHLDTTWYHLLAGPLETNRSGKQDKYAFLFVSNELDEYMRGIVKLNKDLDHDLTKLYSTENVYSNIVGGVGIFGSYICNSIYMGV